MTASAVVRSFLAGMAAALALAATAMAQTPQDSLTLDRAVAMALEHSASVRQAAQLMNASAARTAQAHSARLPQIEADASYRRVDPTISVDFPINGSVQTFSFFPNNNYEAAITAQQVITDFGRTSAREDFLEAVEQSAGHTADQARLAAAYQTVTAFNNTLLLERNLAVIDDQIAALTENLHLAQRRLTEGTATNFDLLSTQVRLTTVKNQRVDVEGSLRKQQAVLRRLLGLRQSEPVAVTGGFSQAGTAADPATLITDALRQRPEYLLALDAENAARLQLAAARTTDNPSLSINVTGGVKNGFPPDLNAPKLNWAGGVRLAVPLFDGNRTGAMEAEAQANLDAATAAAEDVKGTITMEVEQALADVETNIRRLSTADAQVEQAAEALGLARTRYTNGVITNLELLNAQTAVQEAQFLRVQYQYNVTMSVVALDRAVGVRMW